jgi:hypothetical protein
VADVSSTVKGGLILQRHGLERTAIAQSVVAIFKADIVPAKPLFSLHVIALPTATLGLMERLAGELNSANPLSHLFSACPFVWVDSWLRNYQSGRTERLAGWADVPWLLLVSPHFGFCMNVDGMRITTPHVNKPTEAMSLALLCGTSAS